VTISTRHPIAVLLIALALGLVTSSSLLAQGLLLNNPARFGGAGTPLTVNAFPQAQNLGPVYNPLVNNFVNPGLSNGSLFNNFNNPFWNPANTGFNPWGGSYFGDLSMGNTLQGSAAVINAQGQFNIQNQQAKLVQQQVEMAKIETRRRMFDEWLYERANTSTIQDRREAMQRLELRKAMNDPPLGDILSGASLDVIYQDLLSKQMIWDRGPIINIDDDVLKRINLRTANGGNAGLLKQVNDDQGLPWPVVFNQPTFAKKVEAIDNRMKNAVKQATANDSVDAGTVTNLSDDVEALRKTITANVGDLTPSESVVAHRFLKQLDDAITALRSKDVGAQLKGKLALKGKTVADLLRHMSAQGLTFGAATTGDERAYVAVRNYLMGFNLGLSQTTALPLP
jgi:hypothetical protein